ncbi:MAG: thioredoxin family protein, partial [Odoribacter sp.]|nr:thioredoxin family protein [Odoribacter sp.]
VEFYAKWCPHCQKMLPVIEDLKHNADKGLKIQTFDIDEPSNRPLLDYYRIQSVPTLLLFKDREQVWRQSGEITYPKIKEVIERYRQPVTI